MMSRLRNPGLFSFLIFLTACAMVLVLYKLGAPDSVKLAGQLVGLVVAGFGARSVFASPPPKTPDVEPTPRTTLPYKDGGSQ